MAKNLENFDRQMKNRRAGKGFASTPLPNVLEFSFGRPGSRATSSQILGHAFRAASTNIIRGNKNHIAQTAGKLVKTILGDKILREQYKGMIDIVNPAIEEQKAKYEKTTLDWAVEHYTDDNGKVRQKHVLVEKKTSTLDMDNEVFVYREDGKPMWIILSLIHI